MQKFNETKNWHCATIIDLHNRIEDIEEANHIFDSLHICDPAVGSGHFLVSALNVLIALKCELGILKDQHGKRLKNYHIEVIDDELVVLDEEEQVFNYRILPNGKVNTDIQRVQETLFHQKQTLIESCLFGVDINPNSVKICRLRLWIELLKNAYYTTESGFSELETLPNIDINIKQGNSLVSKYKLDEDLTEVFQKQKFSLATYRDAVQAYKDSKSKDAKAELLRFINEIKEQFKQSVSNRDPRRKQLSELRGKRTLLDLNIDMFGNKSLDDEQLDLQKRKFDKQILELDSQIADVTNAKIYKNSFEWRFEFPEVLNEKGEFVGFDVVIGNPPYGAIIPQNQKAIYSAQYKTFQGNFDIYLFFIEHSLSIVNPLGFISFITPDTWINVPQSQKLRLNLLNETSIHEITIFNFDVFDEAKVNCVISQISAKKDIDFCIVKKVNNPNEILGNQSIKIPLQNWINNKDNQFIIIQNETENSILTKIIFNSILGEDCLDVSQGIVPYSKENHSNDIIKNRKFHSTIKENEDFGVWIQGRSLGRYSISISNSEYLHYGKWLHRARNQKYFNGERILIQEITSGNPAKITATIYEHNLYHDPGIIVCLNKSELDIRYILGLLNSTLFSWFVRKTSPKGERKTFPKVLIGDIRNLRFRLSTRTAQFPFIEKVNQILALKKADPKADTSDLEAEIDRMVYRLYDLTAEEILIVEGK